MQDKLIEAEIDDGILGVVLVLNDAGVKTFSSCQGGGYGWGHGYLRPIVCFDGDDSEGERAEKIATDAGYQVFPVQRVWYTRDGERVGPFWEMEFVAGAACRAPKDRATVRAHDAPETEPWWEKEWAESFKKYREYAAQHGCPLGGDLLEFVLQDALAYRASHATESAPVAQPMEEALTSSAEELGYPCQQPAAEPVEDAVERIVCHACGMAMVFRRVDTKTLETFHTCAEARKGYVAGAAYRELMAAAQAHVNALEACEPAISNAFGFSAIHGGNYTGPTYGKELTALKAALAALPAQDAELEKEK